MKPRRMPDRISVPAIAGLVVVLMGGLAVSSELEAPAKLPASALAQPRRFDVAQAFAVGSRIGVHAVGAVGFNFRTYFYPLVETETGARPLDAWTLGHAADDATLIDMVGGEDKIAVSLAAIHRLIARSDSETEGRSNFAYARSPVDGRLWAIHWIAGARGEWIVGAVLVPNPDLDWPAGSRLFVPDSGGERRCPAASRVRLVCAARP